MDKQLEEYFAALNLKGISLSQEQKNWYAKKWETLQEDMMREYPSFPEEAFMASQEGNWYARQLNELYEQGHITTISYDKSSLVHTAWDLGQADATSIWFFQINRVGEIMVIDYFEAKDSPLSETAQILKDKGYSYGSHIWPPSDRDWETKSK